MHSFLFHFAALVLFFNDFWAKSAFHNTLTGKLSDFAGIALWVLFWEAIRLRFELYRIPRVCIYAITAIGFVWFKSPYAQSVLDWLQIVRVIDYTDLVALSVLPLLYHFSTAKPTPDTPQTHKPVWQLSTASLILALFLFGATSPQPSTYYGVCDDNRIVVAASLDSLKARVKHEFPTQNTIKTDSGNTYINIGFIPRDCPRGASALLSAVSIDSASTSLRLMNIELLCDGDLNNQRVCEDFQTLVFQKIK